MKKIFLSAVMAIAALAASAQQPVGGISLTPHLGVGYAIASPSLCDKYDGFISAVAGVEATYKATDLFGVSLGLDYGYGQSSSEEFKKGSIKVERYLTQYTFSVPVLAQVHFGQFAIKAGIQPGWIISPKAHFDSTIEEISNVGNIEDQVNSFQLSIPVGISYSPSFPLQFDLRYCLPLTDYLKDSAMKELSSLGFNYENSKLGTIMLTVGYRFDLGK